MYLERSGIPYLLRPQGQFLGLFTDAIIDCALLVIPTDFLVDIARADAERRGLLCNLDGVMSEYCKKYRADGPNVICCIRISKSNGGDIAVCHHSTR